METEMRLFDSGENLIAESDYGGAVSLIGPFTLPADDTYILMAGRPDWSDVTGAFSVMVDLASILPLTSGAEISGRLENANTILFYSFSAETGDLFHIQMYGENVAFLLRSPAGEYLLDEGYYESPYVTLYSIPESGDYTLQIHTVMDFGVEYQLWVNPIIPTPLVSGEMATGTIEDGGVVYFSFESLGAKAWQLDAVLPDGDRYIEILTFRITGQCINIDCGVFPQ